MTKTSSVLRFVLGLLYMLPEAEDHIAVERHRLKAIGIYEIFADDFDRIEDEASRVGTDLQFATAWLPIAITLTITLATVTITNQRIFDAFFLFMLVSYGFGILCGIRAWTQRGRFKRLIARIRARQVGPLGQQESELRPSELAMLPVIESGQASTPEAVSTVSASGEQK